MARELAAALLFVMSTILLLWKQWSAGCASAECGQTVGKRQLVHGLFTRFVGRLHGFNAWWRGDLNLTGLNTMDLARHAEVWGYTRRVRPLGVVEVDPLADDAPGLKAVGELAQIDGLVFERAALSS